MDNYSLAVHLDHLYDKSDKNADIAFMKELNRFFEDISCVEVKYTENNDRPFFGIIIKPIGYDIKQFIESNNDVFNFYNYSVEIDSKLFDNGLTSMEVLSLIIYDITNIVSKSAVNAFRTVFEYYVGASNTILNYEKVITFDNLFKLVMEESIRILCSCIDKRTDEINVADDYMKGLELDGYFNSAMDKIVQLKNSIFINEIPPKLTILQWYLCIINDLTSNSRDVTNSLRDAIHMTGSKLIKVSIINTINEIEPMTDNAESMYRALTESKKGRGLFSQIKQNGLKSIEEDIYEYNMRIKNVETEADAINLMRLLNSRITILDDYLIYEDIDDKTRDRYNKVLDKYLKLREDLSKKTVYKQKMYGLFVDYNALQNMADRGQLDTYY